MKALSLHQPWASLVILGEKRVETRSWATGHRGLLAIHAVARIPPHGLEFMRASRAFRQVARRRRLDPEDLPMGTVLGIVRLLDCVPVETMQGHGEPGDQERSFGDYSPGRYAWPLEVVEAFDSPIPARGMQGLWTWDPPR